MPRAKRALAMRSILGWGRGDARAARRRRGVGWVMSPSARKMMLHSNVVGELEELAVLVTVSTRKPACFGWVQNKASGDAAHDVFS